MMEARIKSKRSDEWVDTYKGAKVTPEMVTLKIEGEARILRPDGKPLAVYLPGAAADLSQDAQVYGDFSSIRMKTDNRGYASGTERVKRNDVDSRTRTEPVMSAIIGSFEKTAAHPACRLTAFNAHEVEKWDRLVPMFQRIAGLLEGHVPDRYAAQVTEANRTHPDWIIRETPFTTITVNNTYPTGIHTDKGDLDAGFSTLACIRRGFFTGGWLTFPQYGLAVDMKDGDVLLMDAHDWHGNTVIQCAYCQEALREPNHRCAQMPADVPSPERISIVSYFRTNMTKCDSMPEEDAKRADEWNKRSEKSLGIGVEA